MSKDKKVININSNGKPRRKIHVFLDGASNPREHELVAYLCHPGEVRQTMPMDRGRVCGIITVMGNPKQTDKKVPFLWSLAYMSDDLLSALPETIPPHPNGVQIVQRLFETITFTP